MSDSRRPDKPLRSGFPQVLGEATSPRRSYAVVTQIWVLILTQVASLGLAVATALYAVSYENSSSYAYAANLATIGISLSTLLLGCVLHYRVVRPIRGLVAVCRDINAGRFEASIHATRDDELGELAIAIDSMRARFQYMQDDLDQKVRDRTRQVIRSEQLANVGYLAAGIAHEVNNPLAAIAMCSESVYNRVEELRQDPQKSSDWDTVLGYLDVIGKESFRCKNLTEQLLDLSRAGAELRSPTDLRSLVDDIVEVLRHVVQHQGKSLTFEHTGPLLVEANAQEIKQVILNLTTNALESISVGGMVAISMNSDDRYATVYVSDDGKGMSPEVLKHVFEPFFTIRRSGKGTGLGLSISYRIIQEHNGEIVAHSDGDGKGATFKFRLPLLEEA